MERISETSSQVRLIFEDFQGDIDTLMCLRIKALGRSVLWQHKDKSRNGSKTQDEGMIGRLSTAKYQQQVRKQRITFWRFSEGSHRSTRGRKKNAEHPNVFYNVHISARANPHKTRRQKRNIEWEREKERERCKHG